MSTKDKLTIVIPTYNEQEVLHKTNKVIRKIIDKLIKQKEISLKSEILYVDDGSKDKTWEIIANLSKDDSHVSGIRFSGNFGHQNALIAGIKYAENSSYIITIDSDLQDDPNAIFEMVKMANDGKDIVYGVRSKRTSDSFIKRFTAESFYKLMSWMGTKTIYNHADFRLINRRVTKAFLEYPEREMFLRGVFPSMGFNSGEVYYERSPREAGVSKYPFTKMLKFALDGITSFSITPIKMVLNLGILFAAIGSIYALFVIIAKLRGDVVPGWPSLIISIWFVGGVQLIAVGIIGEYIGRIFNEVKHRPRYIIAETTEKQKKID